MAEWKVELRDLEPTAYWGAGVPLTDGVLGVLSKVHRLDNATIEKCNIKVNRMGEATIKLNPRNQKVDLQTLVPWRHQIWIWRDSKLIFFGPIIGFNIRVAPNSEELLIYANTYHKYFETAMEGAIGPYGPNVYTGVDAGAIAWDLINSWQESFFYQKMDLGVRQGTIDTSVTRDRNYTESKFGIYEAITNLTEVINGFDYKFRYNSSDNTVYFDVHYPRLGSQRTDLRPLELTRQITDFEYAKDGTTIINREYIKYPDSGSSTGYFVAEEYNTQSGATYFRHERVLDRQDLTSATAWDYARYDVVYFAEPLIGISVGALDPNIHPTIFDAELGDDIRVKADIGNLSFDEYRRIIELSIRVDEDGNEIVEPILASLIHYERKEEWTIT